jgi:hypothetical protein
VIEKNGLLEIKDQSLNILILAQKFEVAKRIRGETDRKMYLCYKDTKELRTLIERWQSNLPLPIKDARDFFLGTEIYWSNLHAHLDEGRR